MGSALLCWVDLLPVATTPFLVCVQTRNCLSVCVCLLVLAHSPIYPFPSSFVDTQVDRGRTPFTNVYLCFIEHSCIHCKFRCGKQQQQQADSGSASKRERERKRGPFAPHRATPPLWFKTLFSSFALHFCLPTISDDRNEAMIACCILRRPVYAPLHVLASIHVFTYYSYMMMILRSALRR